jgi:hypothetical protein
VINEEGIWVVDSGKVVKLWVEETFQFFGMDNEFFARAVTVGLEPGFLVKKNDRIYMRKN